MIVVIDDPNRYKPQPTSCTGLFLNVINEQLPLTNPVSIKIIVNSKLILIIIG